MASRSRTETSTSPTPATMPIRKIDTLSASSRRLRRHQVEPVLGRQSPPRTASLAYPTGVTRSSRGRNCFVADYSNHRRTDHIDPVTGADTRPLSGNGPSVRSGEADQRPQLECFTQADVAVDIDGDCMWPSTDAAASVVRRQDRHDHHGDRHLDGHCGDGSPSIRGVHLHASVGRRRTERPDPAAPPRTAPCFVTPGPTTTRCWRRYQPRARRRCSADHIRVRRRPVDSLQRRARHTVARGPCDDRVEHGLVSVFFGLTRRAHTAIVRTLNGWGLAPSRPGRRHSGRGRFSIDRG